MSGVGDVNLEIPLILGTLIFISGLNFILV